MPSSQFPFLPIVAFEETEGLSFGDLSSLMDQIEILQSRSRHPSFLGRMGLIADHLAEGLGQIPFGMIGNGGQVLPEPSNPNPNPDIEI